tara:strand:+ start:31 stop:429 length:399 start_codon:yes stop_codon:yes gene_type:complete
MIKQTIRWFEKHNRLSWIITVLIAIFILYMSSLSFEGGGSGGIFIKPILYHFVIFSALAFFFLISRIKGDKKKIDLLFSVISLAILYAISDEIHQLFVPGRAFTIADILTDSAGIFFASLIYSWRLKSSNNK